MVRISYVNGRKKNTIVVSCSIEITSNGGDAFIFDIIIIIIGFWQRVFACDILHKLVFTYNF